MEAIGVVVQDGEGHIDPTYEHLMSLVSQVGLRGWITGPPVGTERLYSITVGRDAENASDWSLRPTRIAIGPSISGVSAKAIDALNKMAPRLQKALDAASPEPPETRIAAGISGDGTVTALRVERDGTVRLAPEDIEAIAEAVYNRLTHEGRFNQDTGKWVYTPEFHDGQLPESDLTWLPDGTIGPRS